MEAVDKKINQIIKRKPKPSGRKEQRVELLRRNEIFSNQFDQISRIAGKEFFKVKGFAEEKLSELLQDKKLLKLDYPKVKIKQEPMFSHIDRMFVKGYSPDGITSDNYVLYIDGTLDEKGASSDFLNLNVVFSSDPTDKEITVQNRLEVLNGYKSLWEAFCYRWHIDANWDGNLDHLSRFQIPFIAIGYDENNKTLPIIIRINSWTTQKDVRDNWNKVKSIQEKIFHKEKESSNIYRDLCWYDLHQLGLKYREIAKIWINKNPEEIDHHVATQYIKENKDTLGDISPEDLLVGIRSNDPQFKDEIENFELFKREYTMGESGRGRKISSPFSELIRISIKNLKKKIQRSDKF